jgi:hypothetical protein
LFEDAEWLKPSLRAAMIDAKIPKVIEILNRLGFPDYYAVTNDAVIEKEVTLRLLAIFQTAGLLPEETRQFFSGDALLGKSVEGDIDIATKGLPINYIIEIKCGTAKKASILDGIKQQIEYATKTDQKRISFVEALQGRARVYLLTIHFKERHGGKIDEWVFLPFAGARLRFDELEASSPDKVRNMKSKMNIDPNYTVD